MKKSRMLVGIMAVVLCGTLTACGKEQEEVVEETKPTMYAKEKNLYDDKEDSENESVTEKTDIPKTEHNTEIIDTEETTGQVTADEMTAEKAVELCRTAYDAFVTEESMEEIADVCDMELYYYFETGEITDDIEELTTYTGEFLETDNLLINSGIDVDDIRWDSATKLSRKKTTEWNKFIQEYMKKNFDDSPAEAYEFEEIWAVDVYEPESDSTEEVQNNKIIAVYDFENPLFLVVKYNGEWKADLLLSMTRQIYDGLTAVPVEETTDTVAEEAESVSEST